jgi:hypothetical protein
MNFVLNDNEISFTLTDNLSFTLNDQEINFQLTVTATVGNIRLLEDGSYRLLEDDSIRLLE